MYRYSLASPGHKAEQIAEMQAVSKPTIYGWYDRWRSSGVEGLSNKPKSERTPMPGQIRPCYTQP